MSRVEVKNIESKKRLNNFDEVCIGYNEEEAVSEAERCLLCKDAPCVKGCPAGIDIPSFIKEIKEKNYDKALEKITESNVFSGVCGRVCPYEKHCEQNCVLKKADKEIAIGHLERFAADNGNLKIPKIMKIKKKIAVVGTGPASLSCAAKLALKGYDVSAFEALHKPGGVLQYGIPEFRLPKKVFEKDLKYIKDLGVKIILNKIIGKTRMINDIASEFDAVFLGTGAGTPNFLGIEGEELRNVYSANEFLTRVNLMGAHKFPEFDTPVKKGSKFIIVGGGNVAMDAARVAKRMGSEVTVVYRRSFDEMTARPEEVKNAQCEGIQILTLTTPVRIMGCEEVECVECIQMKLGEEDDLGRKIPSPIEGTEFSIEADQVIIAVGQNPNPLIAKTGEVMTGGKNKIIVNENLQTSIPNVFAGGDAVSGAATVVEAIRDGNKAAEKIDEFLNSEIEENSDA